MEGIGPGLEPCLPMDTLSVTQTSAPLPREDSKAFPDPVPSWKRVLDTACVLAAAPLLLPLGLGIALAIKMVSPGPVLFAQDRVGYRGRWFRCFKFRSMTVNADTGVHQGHFQDLMASNRPMTKLDGADKRLIRGGRLLRCLGLDELPQLINVLRGEMSLVGPRPCLPYECEHYQPRHWRRFGTLPGLTGLWQVNGKNRTTFEEMIYWDLKYVETKSPALDCDPAQDGPSRP